MDLGGCGFFERIWLNDTKTCHLEHLDNLQPVMVQNDMKTDRLEIYLDGLGTIQNKTKATNFESLNDTLCRFDAFQASRRKPIPTWKPFRRQPFEALGGPESK